MISKRLIFTLTKPRGCIDAIASGFACFAVVLVGVLAVEYVAVIWFVLWACGVLG
jgi:hypothetical protein